MRWLFLSGDVTWHGNWFRCFHLGRHLAERGHQITLVSTGPKRRWKPSETMEGQVRLVETPPCIGLLRLGYWNKWVAPGIFWRSWMLFRSKWDVIVASEHWPDVCVPPYLFRRLYRGFLVADWGDWWTEGGLFTDWRLGSKFAYSLERALEHQTKLRADAVTTITRSLYERALRLGVPESRLLYLPSGADTRQVRPFPKHEFRLRLGIPLNAPVVGYMGITSPERLIVVAQMFKLIAEQVPEVHFLVVGPLPDGNRPSWDGVSSSRIVAPGMVAQSELSAYLSAADIWLLPFGDQLPVRALWPNKLMDYMAAGRPVVAMDHEDLRPLFAEHEIGLLAEHNVEDMVKKVLWILDHSAIGESWGCNGRQVVEQHYDWSGVAANFEKFVLKLMRKHV